MLTQFISDVQQVTFILLKWHCGSYWSCCRRWVHMCSFYAQFRWFSFAFLMACMVASPENDYLMQSINNPATFLKVFAKGICSANCVLRTQPLGFISFFRSLILKLTIIGNKGIYAQSVFDLRPFPEPLTRILQQVSVTLSTPSTVIALWRYQQLML